jgi:hypothetical protein
LFNVLQRRDGVKLVKVEAVGLEQPERLLQFFLGPLGISLGRFAGKEAFVSVGFQRRS